MMSLVWEHYPVGGGELLAALAYADHAHDDGSGIRPSVRYVANKTRQSERTVQRYLARMRKNKWLLIVRNGDGGRGYATEYRINPQWITNPDILSPFSISGQKRVSPEVKKGDSRGSKRVTPVSPQPPRTVIEPTTTHEECQDNVVVDDLIWPSSLHDKAVMESALLLMKDCPQADRQNVLDELAGLADRGAVRYPIGLLRRLIESAAQGSFVPAAALEFQRKRATEKKAAERFSREKKRRQKQACPVAKQRNREQLAVLRKNLKGTNNNDNDQNRNH
ncbi:MAG: hypothetical protein ABW134_15420 [Candidatus Thiodiazotropha endolucinida]